MKDRKTIVARLPYSKYTEHLFLEVLLDIRDKLEEIRCGLIDIEEEVKKAGDVSRVEG